MLRCSAKVFSKWIAMPWLAKLVKNILGEVGAVGGGMIPLMTLMAQSPVALALLILLLIVDPLLALSVCIVLGLAWHSLASSRS
jgi:hypothetical protein